MFNIAIDGPSASGKSTIAKQLARILNFTHIDTGAMYRAIAYQCLKNKIDLNDEIGCTEVANHSVIELLSNGEVFINDMNVTQAIRHEKVSQGASAVSRFKGVRQRLVEMQQEMAKSKGFVMDGRDITSVVLPDAEVKIFQTADVAVRAKRRYDQLIANGANVEYDDVYTDLVNRDYQDTHRDESPLMKVDNAVEIDTTYLSIEESVALIMEIIESRGLK
ncbi:cytidylate kinase [Erysipelothrix larvae]|uniref:Cytidylate kinase n=1 Tax=Erysipelothrix larvae TaxID=1514105 RepID=A0A109UGZ4_9FIRM|nr:(d)CMP kinase [Erysipelothrix larvae]AMC93348.1 cytidylate kinase [Erysipelothrix larvae]